MDLETIVAVATPPGRGGVAIVRISGNKSFQILKKLLKKQIPIRQAILSDFYDHLDKKIDQGIAIFFPNPHSFTGEDILELHTHGNPIITDWIIETVVHYGGRLARAGEFSERAFLNGKVDLAEAEAIADLIDASSRQTALCALRSLQGEFSKEINDCVALLVTLRVEVEAAIDFSDEEIEFIKDQSLINQLEKIIFKINNITQRATEGCRLREGITIVLSGKPNTGKSSLLNVLSGRSTAIVTPIAGTTRDVLREHIIINGLSIQLIDTAGIRENSQDPIEQEGIRRALEELKLADIVLIVHDATSDEQISDDALVSSIHKKIYVRNKIDLIAEKPHLDLNSDHHAMISLSAQTGEGIDILKSEIYRLSGLVKNQEGIFLARRRHLNALKQAEHYLNEISIQSPIAKTLDCIAEDLRLAQQSLCEITGEFTPDDLLGEIFSSFCIGK